MCPVRILRANRRPSCPGGDPSSAVRIKRSSAWNSNQAKAAGRAKSAGARHGYVWLNSIVDGFSRLAYPEPPANEKAATAAALSAHLLHWVNRVQAQF
jgi:hypothetical protein